MTNLRRVERKTDNGWEVIRLADLKAGDWFRCFEPDGSPLMDNRGDTFLCKADAFLGQPLEDGCQYWTVETVTNFGMDN